MSKIRVVHYINQFFAGVGGEEQAHIAPELRTELPPISVQLQGQLGEEFEVVATVVCGDSYFNENLEKVQKELLEMIKGCEPQLFIAGPAFNAGRYGVAAGTITKAVQDELGIPAVTAMYVENPGTDMFRKEVYILETADSAAGMRKALPKLAKFAAKLAKGEEILSPKEEGYHERGIRVNFFSDKRGSERAVEMLVKKIKGEEFETEYPMPNFDRVDPNPAVKDLSKAKIALVTSGGIVPKGNPDHIESSSASKYGEYSLEGFTDLTAETHETAHGGYDPVYANEDADFVKQIHLIETFKGAGFLSAVSIMGEIGDFSAFSKPKQLFAYFGLDPAVKQSGKFEGTKVQMSKRGSAIARRVIHMLTLQSISISRNGEAKNPVLREYYLKKCDSKPKLVAMGAVSHKVCNMIFAILRDNKPFKIIAPQEHIKQYNAAKCDIAA